MYKEECGIGKEGQQEERERERKERAKGREWRDSDEIHQRSVSVSLEDFSDFHLSFSFLSLAGDLPFSPARHRDHHYSRSRSRSQDRGTESRMRFKLFFLLNCSKLFENIVTVLFSTYIILYTWRSKTHRK